MKTAASKYLLKFSLEYQNMLLNKISQNIFLTKMVKVTDTTDSCQVKSPNSRIFFLAEKTLKLSTFLDSIAFLLLSVDIFIPGKTSWLVILMN